MVKIQGDRVTLATPPLSRGGVMQTFEPTWERVKLSASQARRRVRYSSASTIF